MNKKILMITVMLLAMLTVAMVPVQAAKKDKLDFELQYWGPMTTEFGGKSHAGPVGTEGQDYPTQRTFHGRDITHGVFVAIITIDGEEYHFVAAEWNINGEWEFLCADTYTHQYTITQTGNTFTGEGTYPAEGTVVYYELISGTINPITGQVTMNGVYYSDSGHTNPTGYTFTAAITIDPSDGSMDGILTSQGDLSFVSTSGEAIDEAENDFDIEVTGSFEFNHNTLRKDYTATGTFKNKETITFSEGNTIELLVVKKIVFAFNTEYEIIGMTSEGSIVGHGTGTLKGVKIVGTTTGDPFMYGWSRVGTIMGWSGLP